jgi:hypothetical protein
VVALAEYDFQPGRTTPQLPELTHTQREAAEDDFHAGLIGLIGIVADILTVDELLTQVAEFAAHAIPGVEGAAATLAHPSWARWHIQAWAVAAEFVREIDTLQYEVHNEGPCITSMCTGRPCVSGSIGDDTRWPRFGPAVARLGVNSALSLPLMLGEQVVGAIDTYAYSLDAFAEHAVAIGAMFAGPAAVSVYNAWLLMEARYHAEQLQRALGSRSVIDQAIGIIRSQSGASAQEAFGRLVKISQSENVKLHVIAEQLVDVSVRRARARHEQA